jgi:hypothetical protein
VVEIVSTALTAQGEAIVELLRAIASVPEHRDTREHGVRWERSAGTASLKVIGDVEGLSGYTADLEDLAGDLAAQNVSYEPWAMLPIAAACAGTRTFVFVLVFEDSPTRGSRLIAFFPFERVTLHPLMPLSCLRLWADPFNYLNARCDPLIRRGYESCTNVLLDWFAHGQAGADLLNLRGLTDSTPVTRAIMLRLSDDPSLKHIHGTIESHLYRRQADASSYMSAALSSKSQQTLRRYERRLQDLGSVEYADVGPGTDVEPLIDEFIDLEHKGWKGQQGVSVVAYGHRELVRQILAQAHRQKRLSLLTMRVGGKLVAARCVFLASPGSFLFKLTYDEDDLYAKRSPGLLLELEAIRRMHSDEELLGMGVEWLDTCSSPYSSIFSRSRSDALKVHRFIVARRWTVGAAALAAYPHVCRVRDSVRNYGRRMKSVLRTSRA